MNQFRNHFAIKYDGGHWYDLPYFIVYNGSRVAQCTATLFGARWWIKHRSAKWLEAENRRPVVIERINV